MHGRMAWDERKRLANLARHGLDFSHAVDVLESRYRLDIPVRRATEWRVLSISYPVKFLATLAVVHVHRNSRTRIISFRPASTKEREVYGYWLENECDDS